MRPLPDFKYLNECFSYEKSRGVLIWKNRPLEHFDSSSKRNRINSRTSGKIAGCFCTKNKYILVGLDSNFYRAHRLIWKICTGFDPTGEIDHINGDRSDNRIDNLRDVSSSENHRNKSIRIGRKIKIMGVYFCEKSNKWYSQIYENGKNIHLGRFSCFLDACCARKSAELKYNYHKNHNRVINKTGNNKFRNLLSATTEGDR